MKEYTKREILFDMDFPPVGPITDEMVERAKELSNQFYTEHEIEKMRKKQIICRNGEFLNVIR